MTAWHKIFRFGYEYYDKKGEHHITFISTDAMGEERQNMFDELCEFATIFGKLPDEAQWKHHVMNSSVTILLSILETEDEHQVIKGYVFDKKRNQKIYSTIHYDTYRDLLIHELSTLLSKVEVTV